MKCFIAMAFFHDDTDAMYEVGIKHVLRNRGIQPIRIDQLIHNDNITDRIMEEIKTADFMIADLTYARPSVYYEAGFAERVIPVIYTVRRDHFRNQPDDKFGVLKVHFDLSVKNIIDWVSGEDNIFQTRLEARIDLIMEPIVRRLNEQRNQYEYAIFFSGLPIKEKEKNVANASANLLNKYRFTPAEEIRKKFGNTVSTSSIWEQSSFFSTKGKSYKFLRINIHTEIDDLPSMTLGIDDYSGDPKYNLNVFHNLNQIDYIEDYMLVCCFHSISFQALCHQMADFRSDTQEQSLIKQSTLIIPVLPDSFAGDVILDDQNVAENAFKKFWNGGDRCAGFLTKTPPLGTYHVRGEIYKEFQFVYKGFSTRMVQRIKKIFVLNDIVSIEDFNYRFTKILESIA